MKRLIFILLAFVSTISFGQYQYNFMKETFFGRQPSARAEAMGKSFVSVDGDMTCMFYNPAGTATVKGIEINGSYASPYYLATNARYNYTNLGYKIKNYLTVGFSRNNFKLGTPINLIYINGNIIGTNKLAYSTNYTINLSSQPLKNLFIGLNGNYLIWQPGIEKPGQSIYFDFGAIKKIALLKKNASEHSIGIGSSIANLNYAKMTVKYNGSKSESSLPVITRYGINYQLMLDKHLLIDTLKTIKLLAQGEYQKVLNSKYESAIRSGAEVMVLELLSLRIGYYKEKEYNYGYSNVNKSEISSITYGVGVQIPLHKLTKVPLNISFDYTKLPQPNYSLIYSQLGNFTTYNLRLNWILKSRK